MISLCVFFIFSLLIITNADSESKIVNTTQGPVRGHKSTEWNLYEFYGIPYATAPKGEHKFKEPQPPPTWTDTFDAVHKNIVCPQNKIVMENYGYNADYNEKINCLVANILVSDTNDNKKPVIVYVHGGAYQLGVGTFLEPKTLVEEGNIVAVTFNYRLSIEGFLCLGTEKVPGNAGMKDMVALLRWVQNNIASFGGNPNDVTIAGYSAGSSAVDLLMLSDLTTGLFHKVIPESGVGAAVWSVQQDPLKTATRFAKSMNFSSSNIPDLERFFTTASYETLTTFTSMGEKDSTFQFVPCIENDNGQERFLSDNPLNILKKGKFRKVPMLLGHASAEGYLRGDLFDLWKDEMNENFADFLPADLRFENKAEKINVATVIKQFYFGHEPVSVKTAKGYLSYFGDVFFNYPDIKSVMLQAEAGNDNIYFYIYSFFDDTTVIPQMRANQSLTVNGAYHCAQSFAISDSPAPRSSGNESKDFKEMKRLLRKIWINFIRTGKPIPDGSTLIPEGWPPASPDATPYMVLDKIPQLSRNLNTTSIKFWDEIYSKYYRAPVPPTPNFKHLEL